MGFNFSVFEMGVAAASTVGGIAKYPSVINLPLTAADGDVAITLDTNVLYSYDTGVVAWVVVGGPGVAITVTDSSTINLDLTTNVLHADLNIGSTTLPANTQGISLLIQPTGSTGLYGYFPAGPVSEVTSSVLQFSGPGKAVGFSFGIQVNQATGATPGYVSAADWTSFARGSSAKISTIFPLMGGNTFISGGLTFQIAPASGTTAGYVTTGSQEFGGDKTFAGTIFGQSGIAFYDNDRSAYVQVMGSTDITGIYNLFLPTAQGISNSFFLNRGAGDMTFAGPTLVKTILGLTLTNSGDVTLGAFLAATSTVGATISSAQVLSFTEAQTTNPGMVSSNAQTWNGVKTFTNYIQFAGGSAISLGATGTAGYTLILPATQGVTQSILENNGLGQFSWRPNGTIGGDILTVSAANGTATALTRFVGVTTTTADRSVSIDLVAGVTGAIVTVQKVDSGVGNILVGATQGINGASIVIIAGQWSKMTFIANGSGFYG